MLTADAVKDVQDQSVVTAMLDRMDAGQLITSIQNAGAGRGPMLAQRLSDKVIEMIPRHGVVRRFGRSEPITDGQYIVPVLKNLVPQVQHRARLSQDPMPVDLHQSITTGVELNLNLDYVHFELSADLAEDAHGLIDRLAKAAAPALAAKEDQNAFVGDESQDSGFTLGITNALEASSLHTGEATATAVTIDSFLQAQAKLPDYAAKEPRWYMSRAFYTMSVLRLYGSAAAGMQIPEDADGMLCGHKVNFVPGMAGADATTGDVPAVFGYLDIATTLAHSPELSYSFYNNFDTDQIHVLVSQFTDFRIWDRGSSKSTDPAGSLVGLQLGSGGGE